MKAVAVIEFPDTCAECNFEHIGIRVCMLARRSTSHTTSGRPRKSREKPSWCPLKPLPYRLEPPTYRKYEDYHEGEMFVRGWNECLEQIEEAVNDAEE